MPDVKTMTPMAAANAVRAGSALLIDVREPDEFRAERIPLAVSAPLSCLPGLLAEMTLGDERPIIFQCQKGGRSARACALAIERIGGRPIYNLAGGIEDWKAAGLPVAGAPSNAPAGIPFFRQMQIVVGTLVFLSVLVGYAGYGAGFAVAGFFGAMLVLAGVAG